jgi:hypothetical protein
MLHSPLDLGFFSGLTSTSLSDLAFACHVGGPLKQKDLTAFHTTVGATRPVRVAAAPEAGLDPPLLYDDADCNANAGTRRVVQVIAAIDVVNVNVVGVVPVCWPRVNESEPIAAVLEARIPGDNRRTVDAEPVVTTKLGTETVIRNATTAVATDALCLLCMLLPLCMLCGVGLLGVLLLLCVLCGLCLLGVLLLCMLCGLCLLGVLLLLCMLRGLGLLGVLLLLCMFCGLGLLGVLLMLRVSRSSGSEKQK